MSGTLIQVLQFFASLSLLVLIHEFGHYITARIFGIRVEKFYLFFNPWFTLYKRKIGQTEYGIGWLPMGGYVSLSGMIDESMNTEQMKEEPKPWEFRTKPAWQRLIVMLAGIVMNILLAITIYTGIIYTTGESYYHNDLEDVSEAMTQNAVPAPALETMDLSAVYQRLMKSPFVQWQFQN